MARYYVSFDIGPYFSQLLPPRENGGIPFVAEGVGGIFPMPDVRNYHEQVDWMGRAQFRENEDAPFGKCSPHGYSFQCEVHHKGGNGAGLCVDARIISASLSK